MALRKPLFTKAQLRDLADEGSWGRGVQYFKDKRVTTLLEDRGVVVAKVMGTQSYRVKLHVDEKDLVGERTCPLGDGGVFCKHCVAAGLAYLDDNKESRMEDGYIVPSRPSRKARRRTVDLEDVRAYLAKKESSDLVEIVMEQVHVDDALRRRLLTETALQSTSEFSADAFRLAIREATASGGFLDYDDAPDFAHGLDGVIQALEDVIDKNHAAEAIPLTEYALERVETALAQADDSDGAIGVAVGRLEELHHKACAIAKPDPVALARRIFDWQLDGHWNTFSGAAENYADVLGKKGLSVYRELAQTEWAKASPPGTERYSLTQADVRWRRLKQIMESLAKASGDVESLVAVNIRDIRSSYDYLRIAMMYRDAGRSDEAMGGRRRG